MHDGEIYDLAIIGGGINGVGIAADAAGRGLRVALVEKGDLGSGTSSASSKLIHGGLRYLEHLELRLVRESLQEREVLLAKAPHIVWPLRFVLPHVPGMRSRAALRAGLFLYDHLARRERVPASGRVELSHDPAGAPLRPDLRHAFSYWDCWVDDARLVVLNARAAAAKGAAILPRTELMSAAASGHLWRLVLRSPSGPQEIAARALVNAAGPWAGGVDARIADGEGGGRRPARLRLVKGSHIVVRRPWSGEQAYLLQRPDGRVVFALPHEERFTLIGTTDVPFNGDPGEVTISPDEEHYLLAAANAFLAHPISAADIVWRYAGVRPLYDDASDTPSKVTRDYRLELTGSEPAGPALLTVIGGKLTTYRRLAEAALERLAPCLPRCGPPWTRDVALPGGDIGPGGAGELLAQLVRLLPELDPSYLARLVRRYGSDARHVLAEARRPDDLGERIGALLSAREIAYLRDREWAVTPDDVLWRRTKVGLHLASTERARAAEAIERML